MTFELNIPSGHSLNCYALVKQGICLCPEYIFPNFAFSRNRKIMKILYKHFPLLLLMLFTVCTAGYTAHSFVDSKVACFVPDIARVKELTSFSFFAEDKDDHQQISAEPSELLNDEVARINRNNFSISFPEMVHTSLMLYRLWVYQQYLPAANRPQASNCRPFYSRATNDYYRFLFRLTPF